jgi:hypothetical protein
MTSIEDRRLAWFYKKRWADRQRQSLHLQQCGPRSILGALQAVDKGATIDAVLADFERLPAEFFHDVIYHFAALADEDGEP